MIRQVMYQGNSLIYQYDNLDKPICICLHGMNMTKEMFKISQLQHLLKDYSLILVDLCGYGDTKINYDNYTIKIFSELLTRLLKQEKIKKCTLAGYCLGGVLALDYTIRNPQIVEHLILIETMIYLPKWLFLTTLPGYQTCYWIFQQQTWLLKLLEVFDSFKNISSPIRINISQAKWNGEVNAFYLKMMKRYEQIDHLKRSSQIQCIVDIIYSRSSFKNVKKTAQDLTRFSFVKIHHCDAKGHFLFLDDALESIILTNY